MTDVATLIEQFATIADEYGDRDRLGIDEINALEVRYDAAKTALIEATKPRKIAVVVSRDDGMPWGAIAVPHDTPETQSSMVAVAAATDLPKFCEVYGFFKPLQCDLPPDPIEAAARRLHSAIVLGGCAWDKLGDDIREHYRKLARIAREDME